MKSVDRWYYPEELKDDFRSSSLSVQHIPEVLAVAWEYNCSVVPEFTNWKRYLALARLGAIGIVAEFNGETVDMLGGGRVFGYDIDEQLDILFGGTSVREEMGRQYKSCIMFMAEKSSRRRGSELFRRYADALAYSPQDYFRIRDSDGLFRFFMAGAIACNDCDDWLSEDENRMLVEISAIGYDSVSFYKHRAEGELCNLFAYASPELRPTLFRLGREIVWSLSVNWARVLAKRCAIHFCQLVAGPIHILMRRYRYIEEGMTMGRVETEEVVEQTRQNVKLWYRNDPGDAVDDGRYEAVMAKKEELLFSGFADMLSRRDEEKCPTCVRSKFYGTNKVNEFSGVRLCSSCQEKWDAYLLGITERARSILPLSESR
jgi:hypothetical protein